MNTIIDRLRALAKGEKPTGYLTNEDGNVFPVFDDKYKPKDMARHIEIVETIARNTKDPEKKAVHEARLAEIKGSTEKVQRTISPAQRQEIKKLKDNVQANIQSLDKVSGRGVEQAKRWNRVMGKSLVDALDHVEAGGTAAEVLADVRRKLVEAAKEFNAQEARISKVKGQFSKITEADINDHISALSEEVNRIHAIEDKLGVQASKASRIEAIQNSYNKEVEKYGKTLVGHQSATALRNALASTVGYVEHPDTVKLGREAALPSITRLGDGSKFSTVQKRMEEHLSAVEEDSRIPSLGGNELHPMFPNAVGAKAALKALDEMRTPRVIERNIARAQDALSLADHILPAGHPGVASLQDILKKQVTALADAKATIAATKEKVAQYQKQVGHDRESVYASDAARAQKARLLEKNLAPLSEVSKSAADSYTWQIDHSMYDTALLYRDAEGEWATNGHWILKVDATSPKYRKKVEEALTEDGTMRVENAPGAPEMTKREAKVQEVEEGTFPDIGTHIRVSEKQTSKLMPIGVDAYSLTRAAPTAILADDSGHVYGINAKYLKSILEATGADSIRGTSGDVRGQISFFKGGKFVATCMPVDLALPTNTQEIRSNFDVTKATQSVRNWTPPKDAKSTPVQTKQQFSKEAGVSVGNVSEVGHNSAIVQDTDKRRSPVLYVRTPDGGWQKEPSVRGDYAQVKAFHTAYSQLPFVAGE